MRFGAETAGALEPVDLGGREAQGLQIVERIVEPGGKQEAAPLRQPPHEELEHRRAVLAAVEIGLHHVEFVEIGGERADGWHGRSGVLVDAGAHSSGYGTAERPSGQWRLRLGCGAFAG